MSKHTILVVDDEEDILELMTSALMNKDHTILTAKSGEEALEKLKAHEVNLVISDQQMSSMDGLSLLKKIKLEYPDIITIMLTGYAKVDTAMDAINEAGVYKFFAKPCSMKNLQAAVSRALELKHLIVDRDILFEKIKGKEAVYKECERRHPGITHVKRDSEGYVLLG
jgi:DNA-binding NtrC family response regulator